MAGTHRPSSKFKSRGMWKALISHFACTGCGQVNSVHCEPLQLVALKNKCLLIAQPLPESEESFCKQRAFGFLFAQCLLLANRCFAPEPGYFILQLPGFATKLGRFSLAGYRLRPYLCLAQLECLGFHCNSNADFSNIETALCWLPMAVKPHKDHYTDCLPSVSRSVVLRCTITGAELHQKLDKSYDQSCLLLVPIQLYHS